MPLLKRSRRFRDNMMDLISILTSFLPKKIINAFNNVSRTWSVIYAVKDKLRESSKCNLLVLSTLEVVAEIPAMSASIIRADYNSYSSFTRRPKGLKTIWRFKLHRTCNPWWQGIWVKKTTTGQASSCFKIKGESQVWATPRLSFL